MSQDNVTKIKERLGIKEVVETYIKLEKAGSNYKGKCPFHNEKTPSFFISPDRDTYYCFGCGAKGDIFTFVQEFEGVDFLGSMKILADRAGIKLEKTNFKKNPKIEIIKKIQEKASLFYEDCFKKNSEVSIYLKKRGIIEKTFEDWRIGFAPSGWKNLLHHLKSEGFKEEDIERAGLIKKGDRGDYYDRFRSRIMFPIENSAGEIVAFSGRIFGPEEDTAKYLNSPETEIFKKSEILYGLSKAKTAIRKNNFSILVEGQMDTIMCHQSGYSNTVATSGTAVTETQLKNLSKLSNNIVIAYDSDDAGFKASERAWRSALEIGMDVKIAPIGSGLDPADLIKKDIKEWKEVIKNSKHIIDILIQRIRESKEDKRKIDQRVVLEIIPYLASIKSNIDQHHFIKKVSEGFDIPIDVINSEIQNYKKDPEKYSNPSNDNESQTMARNIRDRDKQSLEKRLLGVMYFFEKRDKDKFEEIQKGIISIVGQENYDKLLESINDQLEEVIFAVENSFDEESLEKESTELLKNLQLKKLNGDRRTILLELKRAEEDGDESLQNDLLEKINKISKEIQGLN